MAIKHILYRLSKWAGLFALSARLNRDNLPILCYHAFALSDESAFRPKLFMKPGSFRARMQYLRQQNYQVLPLAEAIQRLRSRTLPGRAVVITIDDSFYSVYLHALPVLKQLRFPATLYVTSYYAEKQTPVFRLVVQYMFWKSLKNFLDLSTVVGGEPKTVDLATESQRFRTAWDLIEYGETHCDEPERCSLARRLGEQLGVDYTELVRSRAFSIMKASEIAGAISDGFDLELHTHRHRFSEEPQLARQELEDNRRFLQQFSARPFRHFCYPSGIWSKAHWPVLSEAAIETATTCDSGLNLPDAPPFSLKRVLDGENLSQIEFEAELCGFGQFLRSVAGVLRKNRVRQPASVEVRPAAYSSASLKTDV